MTANTTNATPMSSTTGTDAEGAGFETSKIIIGAFLYIIVVITVVGNAMVLIAVARNKRLQTVFNMYIVNLAVTDILVALTAMSFYATDNLFGYWPFGEFMCGLWIFFDYGMTFASVFTLLAISADRMWAVRWSMHYRTNKTKAKTLAGIALVWMVMLVLWLPALIIDRQYHSIDGVCIWEPSLNKEYVVVVAVVGHHGSCFIIVSCYVSVLVLLRHRAKVGVMMFAENTITSINVRSRPQPAATASSTAGVLTLERIEENGEGGGGEGGENNKEQRNQNKGKRDTGVKKLKVGRWSRKSRIEEGDSDSEEGKDGREDEENGNGGSSSSNQPNSVSGVNTNTNTSTNTNTNNTNKKSNTTNSARSMNSLTRDTNSKEMRAFVTLSYIVITYVICWVPFHVVFDVSAIRPELVPSELYTACFWLAYCNSTINPILYNFSSKDFRKAFKDMFCRRR